jgi:iron(III) transport system ATP-binding protein
LSTTSLNLDRVRYSIHEKDIVQNVSLKLKSGEILSLLGENGSGKTTILRLIAGFLDISEGAIYLNNERILGPSEKLIAGHKSIKLIHQDYKLAHNCTVWENIHSLLPPIVEKEKEKKTRKLLKDFNLVHIVSKKVEQLSGGEKQRLAIARAMANKPELLLMDEPFSNLDHHNRTEITHLLFKVIREENILAIFVTHDYQDALKYSDQILVLKNGKIVQKGAPSDCYYKPKNEYTAGILGPISKFNNQLIRPENITITPKGTFQAEVISCLFAGNYYQIELMTQTNEKLLTYEKQLRAIGEKIHFSIVE